MLALIKLQNEAIVKLQSRWRGYLTRRPINDGTGKKYQNESDGMTLISSTQLANLYSTLNQLQHENKLQRQRSDAQEKALRILWEEVRKIKREIPVEKDKIKLYKIASMIQKIQNISCMYL